MSALSIYDFVKQLLAPLRDFIATMVHELPNTEDSLKAQVRLRISIVAAKMMEILNVKYANTAEEQGEQVSHTLSAVVALFKTSEGQAVEMAKIHDLVTSDV